MRKKCTFVVAVALALVMLVSFTLIGCKTAATETTAAAATQTTAAAVETTAAAETTAVAATSAKESMVLKWYMATAVDHIASIEVGKMCKDIEAATEGRIKVDLFPAGQLGNEQEGTDMARSGVVALASIGNQMLTPFVDNIQGWMLPFAFDSTENANRFFNEYALDNIYNKTILQATGLRTLAIENYGARQLSTKGIKVLKPDDLKGIKIRSMDQPIAIAYINALGGSPVPIAFSELYMALQTGTVRGQDNPISNVIAGKFYEVQDYLMLTAHASSPGPTVINEDVWKKISPEDQKIIADIIVKGIAGVNQQIIDAEASSTETLKAKGMTIITADELDMAAFRASAEKVISEKFSGAEYDGWREFNKIAVDWVAENCK